MLKYKSGAAANICRRYALSRFYSDLSILSLMGALGVSSKFLRPFSLSSVITVLDRNSNASALGITIR